MERGGSIADSDCVSDAAIRCKTSLELGNEPAMRRNPVRTQAFKHVLGFAAVENRFCYRNAGVNDLLRLLCIWIRGMFMVSDLAGDL